jgi:hypothetical protein
MPGIAELKAVVDRQAEDMGILQEKVRLPLPKSQ